MFRTRAMSSRAAKSWSRKATSAKPHKAVSSSVKPAYDPETDEFMRPLFEDCYTMSFENYPVENRTARASGVSRLHQRRRQ